VKKGGNSAVGKKLSFAEKYKDHRNDTVIVLGDSLVRGVGSCLKKDGDLFKAVTCPGAKIEHVETKLWQLGDREHSHLILMVGTNNLKLDGTEEMVGKYKELISVAKEYKYRQISLVSILDRKDVSNFHDCRSNIVNSRLKETCEAAGVGFIQISNVRNFLSNDGLHLNAVGQDLVARHIFAHVKQHLN